MKLKLSLKSCKWSTCYGLRPSHIHINN